MLMLTLGIDPWSHPIDWYSVQHRILPSSFIPLLKIVLYLPESQNQWCVCGPVRLIILKQLFVDAFSKDNKFSDSVWDCFPKCEFVIDKALQQNLNWVVLAVFFSSNYFYFDISSTEVYFPWCAENVFHWPSIEVYFPWCPKNILTLIINRSLFAMMHLKYFNFDHESKFICNEVRKIFLLCLWSTIKVYLTCTENIFTLIINRSCEWCQITVRLIQQDLPKAILGVKYGETFGLW